MICQKSLASSLLAGFFLLVAVPASFAETVPPASSPLTLGLEAYARSDWEAAAVRFRQAVTENPASAEGWFWLVMSEISCGEIEAAFSDMDRFILSFSGDARVADILYQKGRLQFLTQSYDEAIQTLHSFIISYPGHRMIPSAYYWIAETLFACGRFEEAGNIYAYLIDMWPQSAKTEAAVYRLALIEEKKIESSLLDLLQASHEESLRVVEDYQRRERAYEQAIASYQRRVSDMMKDTRLSELEASLNDEKRRNSELINAAALLEAQNADLVSALIVAGVSIPESAQTERTQELEAASAEEQEKALQELRRKAERARAIYDAD